MHVLWRRECFHKIQAYDLYVIWPYRVCVQIGLFQARGAACVINLLPFAQWLHCGEVGRMLAAASSKGNGLRRLKRITTCRKAGYFWVLLFTRAADGFCSTVFYSPSTFLCDLHPPPPHLSLFLSLSLPPLSLSHVKI